MRYVLEIRNNDDTKEEIVTETYEDGHERFDVAMGQIHEKVQRVTLWKEFDSIEEAMLDDDKCVYYKGNHNGKATLRSCSASASTSLWR